MVDPLTRLAITYGTDKFGYHDYTPNYYKLFKHLRRKPIRLLEIGVGGYQDSDRGGESLEVWRDFFPNGQIVGIDIQKKDMDLGARVDILQGSQVDPEFLAGVVRDHGPFDIIIDDGSHQNQHVVTSFELLYPTLAENGIYVVEDVQTAFFPRFGGSLEMTQPNSVGYFTDLFVQFDHQQIAAKFPEAVVNDLVKDITAIERFHNMIALHKSTSSGNLGNKPLFKPLRKKPVQVLSVGGSDASVKEALALGKCFPKGQVISFGGVSTKTQAAENVTVMKGLGKSTALLEKAVRDHGPFDVILTAGDLLDARVRDRFELLFPALKLGGLFVVDDMQTALESTTDGTLDLTAANALSHFSDLFVQVDHREIRVNFPDVEFRDQARETYSMLRGRDRVVLHKAPNDYPSNFGFEYTHPQARPVFDAMEKVLLRGGKERGLLLFADIMTRAKDEKRAGKMLKRLAKIGATSRSYYNMAVRQKKLDQDWDGAKVLMKDAVARYPDDYRIRSQLGSVFTKERDWDRAHHEFAKAIELAPRDPLSRQDDADGAVASALVAVEIVPNHGGHRVQLGRLQINAGHLKAAVKTLYQAIEINPEIPNAHRQLSRALHELGRGDEALEIAQQALELRPDNPEYQRWCDRLAAA